MRATTSMVRSLFSTPSLLSVHRTLRVRTHTHRGALRLIRRRDTRLETQHLGHEEVCTGVRPELLQEHRSDHVAPLLRALDLVHQPLGVEDTRPVELVAVHPSLIQDTDERLADDRGHVDPLSQLHRFPMSPEKVTREDAHPR